MAIQPVRFGIAGMDHWYQGFAALRSVIAHPQATVTAAAHRNLAYLEEGTREYKVPFLTRDPWEVVTHKEVDVVVVAATTACLEAVRQGKPVLCVKPMAMTLEEADRVVAAVAEKQTPFFPLEAGAALSAAVDQYRSWLAEGRIGTPISATVIRRGGLPVFEWPQRRAERTWWLDPTKVPGGGWIDHAIYDVHTLRKLLQAEVAEVRGQTANLVHKDIPLEDFGVALLTFTNGVVVTLEVTWSSGPQSGFHAFQLVGTAGQIVTDGVSGKVAVRGEFSPWRGWVLSEALPGHGDAFSAMVEHLRTGKPLPAGAQDGRENLAVCLAFYEAARTGRAVRLR